MPDKPLISILLPAYQASEFIPRTLACWSRQTLTDYELIVSVDRGEDDTFDVCLAHTADNPRARVFQQDQRLGWIRNTNFLLEQARGRLGVFAGHDDLVTPRYLERLAERLRKNPAAVASFSAMYWRDSTGRELLNKGNSVWAYPELDGIADPVRRALVVASGKGPFWTVYRGLFRMAAARAIGGLKFHRGGDFAADWPWIFHLSLLGPFERIEDALCIKVRRPGSAATYWSRSRAEKAGAIESMLRELWASSIPVSDKLQISGPLLQKLRRIVQRLGSPARPRRPGSQPDADQG